MTLILGKLTWVTSEIKHFYHPIINVKEITDKYYPLEFKITDSSKLGLISILTMAYAS